MEMTRRNVINTFRIDLPSGGWNRYKAVLAWLAVQNELTCREWKRIPRAHEVLHRCWESRMRQEGYR